MEKQNLTREQFEEFDTVRERANRIADGIFVVLKQGRLVLDSAVYSCEEGLCYEVTVGELISNEHSGVYNFGYASDLPDWSAYDTHSYSFAEHEEATAFISKVIAESMQDL